MSYPNQRKILIKRSDTKDQLYYQILIEEDRIAATILNESANKLWRYLMQNANGHLKEFSTKDFCLEMNVATSSRPAAWAKLEEYGYLQKNQNSKTYYSFYSHPNEEGMKRYEEIHSRLIKKLNPDLDLPED